MSGVLASRNRRRRADGVASRAPRGRTVLRGLMLLGALGSLPWVGLPLDARAAPSPPLPPLRPPYRQGPGAPPRHREGAAPAGRGRAGDEPLVPRPFRCRPDHV